jgi:hypothetical protein
LDRLGVIEIDPMIDFDPSRPRAARKRREILHIERGTAVARSLGRRTLWMTTTRFVRWLRLRLAFAFAIALAATLVACGGGGGDNPDSGSGTEDSGTGNVDSGAGADSGSSAVDSGSAVADSGADVRDSGSSAADSGSSAADSGGPDAMDGGASSADSGGGVDVGTPPFIASFTAMPPTLPFGGGATNLTWSVTGATSIAIDNGVGDVTFLGSHTVNVTTTTTFTLTASNAAGHTTQTAVVTVAGNPNAPVIASFTHTSGPPVGGGAVTLTWQVTGATSLSIAPGVGDVTGLTSTTVNVLNDTTFTLTATDSAGSTTAQTGVAVQPPAYLQPIVQTSAAPTLDYGSPYDSILGAPVVGATTAAVVADTPCTGATWCPVSAPSVNTFTERVQLIESDSDYLSTLDISGSVSVSAGAFSGSDKYDYFTSHKIDSKSIYLWVDIQRVGQAQEITQLHIDPNAALLDPTSFYRKYGDRYAYLAVTGSELYGLLQIQTQSVTDKRTIMNSLTASISGISGGVDVTNTVTSTLDTVLTGTQVVSLITGSGFQGTIPVYDPSQPKPITTFIDDLASAEHSQTPAMLNTNIRYYYTSYLGLSGYPGLPPNITNLVAQYAAGQADYLLYNAITTKDDDFGHYFTTQDLAPYVAGGTMLSAMHSHVTDMVTWIKASMGNSLGLSPTPTIAPADAFETFATITTTPSKNTNGVTWNAHTLTNGFVPFTAADYEIAGRYADDNGQLNGVTVDFRQYQHVTDLANTSTESPFELYACNEIVGGNLTPSVAFAWPNQLGEFFLDNATVGNFLDASGNITSASTLAAFLEKEQTIDPYYFQPGNPDQANSTCNQGSCETPNRRFVIVSMATGDVMTTSLPSGWNSGSGQPVTASPFTNAPGQLWGFTPFNGYSSQPNTYWIVNDQVGVIPLTPIPYGEGYLLNLSGDGPYNPGNRVIVFQNYTDNPDGNSVFTFFHNTDGYASIALDSQPVNASGMPTVVIGIPPVGGNCPSNCFPDGTALQLVAANGYVNEKWLYVPIETVYVP